VRNPRKHWRFLASGLEQSKSAETGLFRWWFRHRRSKKLNEQRKHDLKSRIRQLNQELTVHLTAVDSLRERIGVLETDLQYLLEEQFHPRQFQTKKFEEIRESR
jgi:hypothetical protein